MTKKNSFWQYFIDKNFAILKFLALVPLDTPVQPLWFKIWYYIANILMLGIFNLSLLIQIYFAMDDVQLLAQTSCVAMLCFAANIKAIIIVYINEPIFKFVKIIQQDLMEPFNKRQEVLANKSMKPWVYAFYVFSSYTILAPMFCSVPLITKGYKVGKLAFGAWYPFDTQVPIFYAVGFCSQFFGFFMALWCNIGIDSLVILFMSFISTQCNLLSDKLKNIDEYCKENNLEGKLIQIELDKYFEKCIEHHRIILELAKISNKITNFIVLTLYFFAIIALALTMFILSKFPPNSEVFLTSSSYMTGVLCELFTYCWFGTVVIVQSAQLGDSLFKSNWIDKSDYYKKNIQFFLLYTKKPIKLFAMNYFEISLQSFTSVVKTSWSYFALLRQVDNNI